MKSALQQLQESFSHHWYCWVFETGLHNGARCMPSSPHDEECRWVWRSTVEDTARTRALLDVEELGA